MVMDERKERVQECAARSGEGAIYLKEFVVSLEKSEKGQPPATYRQSVVLEATTSTASTSATKKARR